MLTVIFLNRTQEKKLRTAHAAKSEILLLVLYQLLKHYTAVIQSSNTPPLNRVSQDWERIAGRSGLSYSYGTFPPL